MKIQFFKIIALALCSLILQTSFAKSDHEASTRHIHGAHNECELPKNTNDIISCALTFHPMIKKESLEINVSDSLYEKMAQIPNPTLSTRYVKGRESNEDIAELETNLSFKLELGGKRKYRKEIAKAHKSKSVKNLDYIKSKVKRETIENLYRLRQILEEKVVTMETISAYKKVISKLKSRPRLSAEQEAAMTLFEMALEEALIEKAELYEEEREVEHYFHISTGHSVDEIKEFLPRSPKRWPKLVGTKEKESVSKNIARLKAFSEIAKQDLNLEKSNSWPDLDIGPSIAIEEDGGKKNTLVGFNVSFSLPLFQANGGAKAYSRSKLVKMIKTTELVKAEETHERYEKLRVYKSSVKTLKRSISKSKINKKQKRIESLYMRGVVSSSVYLDSLKQKLSYIKIRNQRELTAVKSLWDVRSFDGVVLGEKL